jgi:predicted transcriptional regulator
MEGSWDAFKDSIEKSKEYHKRYHTAISNPMRRKILKLVSEGKSVEEIRNSLDLSPSQLEYHLHFLEHGFCIKRDGDRIKLTKEGEIIYYVDSGNKELG